MLIEGGVREPKQLRSKESLERLLAAGIEVLRETGYEGLIVAELGARACVSVGSIYARFKNKEALFQALQIRILERIDREQDALFEGMPKVGMSDVRLLQAVIKQVADHVKRHDALLRVMILRGAIDEDTRLRGSQSSLRLALNFEEFLLHHLSTFKAEDARQAVDVAFRLLYATLTRRVLSGPAFGSPRHVSWDTLVEEMTSALCVYLLGETGRQVAASKREMG